MADTAAHHGSERFDDARASRTPWAIGQPQPAFVAFAADSAIRGPGWTSDAAAGSTR